MKLRIKISLPPYIRVGIEVGYDPSVHGVMSFISVVRIYTHRRQFVYHDDDPLDLVMAVSSLFFFLYIFFFSYNRIVPVRYD